jgi:hypothetical protein
MLWVYSNRLFDHFFFLGLGGWRGDTRGTRIYDSTVFLIDEP